MPYFTPPSTGVQGGAPIPQAGGAPGNGVDIHYTYTTAPADNPDAETIVFGHGLLFSHWMYEPQIAALREKYRCIAVDWRGQGKSTAPASGYDMDTLTDDVIGLIESLSVAPVHYVGLSMGGFVGMRLAARRPDLVRTLTLLDTSAGPEPAENKGKYRLLARIYRIVGLKPLRGQVAPIMFAPSSLQDPEFKPVIDTWLDKLGKVKRSGTKKAIYGVIDRKPVLDELGDITAPTLVIVGEDDAATPVEKSQTIHEHIAGSRLEIIPECGHSATLEKPDEVTALIAGHLAAHSS